MALEGVNRFGVKAAIGGRSSSVVIWEKYSATFGDWPLMQPIARVQSISVFKILGRHASIYGRRRECEDARTPDQVWSVKINPRD